MTSTQVKKRVTKDTSGLDQENRRALSHVNLNPITNQLSTMRVGKELDTEGNKSGSTRRTKASAQKPKPYGNAKSSKSTNGEPNKNSRQMATFKLKVRFMKLTPASKRSPLNNSLMGKSKTEKDAEKNSEIPTIPFSGLQTMVYVNAHFGDVNKKISEPIELLLDTGSRMSWVNKTVYQEALKKDKVDRATPYSDPPMLFKCNYSIGSVIEGEWYTDTISFNHKSVIIDQHVFGIVDEDTCPTAKDWREDKAFSIKGVLAIGSSSLLRNPFLNVKGKTIQNKQLPSVFKNMKNHDQKKISEKTFGFYFQIPDEKESSSISSSSASSQSNSDGGAMEGELHFGAPNINAYIEGSMREIPGIENGSLRSYLGSINLTLRCNDKIMMNDKSGIIDSGSPYIKLPEDVLNEYVKKVGRDADGRQIMIYDDNLNLYRIAKKDFNQLKNLEFNFVKGEDAIFQFPPEVQIVPPNFIRNLPSVYSFFYVLIFQKQPPQIYDGGNHFILGLGWMMHHYVVFGFSSSGKKVWIAEKKKMQIMREGRNESSSRLMRYVNQ